MKFKKLKKKLKEMESTNESIEIKVNGKKPGKPHVFYSNDKIPDKYDEYDVEEIDILRNTISLNKKKSKNKEENDLFEKTTGEIQKTIDSLKQGKTISDKTTSSREERKSDNHHYERNNQRSRNQRKKEIVKPEGKSSETTSTNETA